MLEMQRTFVVVAVHHDSDNDRIWVSLFVDTATAKQLKRVAIPVAYIPF